MVDLISSPLSAGSGSRGLDHPVDGMLSFNSHEVHIYVQHTVPGLVYGTILCAHSATYDTGQCHHMSEVTRPVGVFRYNLDLETLRRLTREGLRRLERARERHVQLETANTCRSLGH